MVTGYSRHFYFWFQMVCYAGLFSRFVNVSYLRSLIFVDLLPILMFLFFVRIQKLSVPETAPRAGLK